MSTNHKFTEDPNLGEFSVNFAYKQKSEKPTGPQKKSRKISNYYFCIFVPLSNQRLKKKKNQLLFQIEQQYPSFNFNFNKIPIHNSLFSISLKSHSAERRNREIVKMKKVSWFSNIPWKRPSRRIFFSLEFPGKKFLF